MDNNKFIVSHDVSDDHNWEVLKEKIREIFGFDTRNYRDNFLKRRVECRLRHTNLHSYDEYVNHLVSSKEEQDSLYKELTIHVTHFFRDKTLFRRLQDWIFPQLIKEKLERGDNKIVIWSAGSSTGQEAYSIAMVLREVLGDNITDFEVKILGTDIDEKTISKAIMGLYDQSSFVEMTPAFKLKYFQKVDNMYSIDPVIKGMVNFKVGDILSSDSNLKYDMIFCRNTVIYFERQAKIDLYESMYSKLKQGGFFIMGKTEFLEGSARTKFEVYDNNERIYRKPYS